MRKIRNGNNEIVLKSIIRYLTVMHCVRALGLACLDASTEEHGELEKGEFGIPANVQRTEGSIG